MKTFIVFVAGLVSGVSAADAGDTLGRFTVQEDGLKANYAECALPGVESPAGTGTPVEAETACDAAAGCAGFNYNTVDEDYYLVGLQTETCNSVADTKDNVNWYQDSTSATASPVASTDAPTPNPTMNPTPNPTPAPTPNPTPAPSPNPTDAPVAPSTGAPVANEEVTCGYEKNYKKCRKIDGCVWTQGACKLNTPPPSPAPTPPTKTPTQEPTTAAYGKCGFQKNKNKCNKLPDCTWAGNSNWKKGGECLVTADSTVAPTTKPTTAKPTTAAFGQCGKVTSERRCKKTEMENGLKCVWAKGESGWACDIRVTQTPTPPTKTPTQEPTTAAYGMCGFQKNKNKCNKLPDCTWAGECLITADITVAPTTKPTTAKPTTAAFGQCGKVTSKKRCQKTQMENGLKCVWAKGSCDIRVTQTPTPPTKTPTQKPTTPTPAPKTQGPTTAAYAMCGFQKNWNKCNKLPDCTWLGLKTAPNGRGSCYVTADITAKPSAAPTKFPTTAPTTEDYFKCGYQKNKNKCPKQDDCMWDTVAKKCIVDLS